MRFVTLDWVTLSQTLISNVAFNDATSVCVGVTAIMGRPLPLLAELVMVDSCRWQAGITRMDERIIKRPKVAIFLSFILVPSEST